VCIAPDKGRVDGLLTYRSYETVPEVQYSEIAIRNSVYIFYEIESVMKSEILCFYLFKKIYLSYLLTKMIKD
jgi:hypothetical protein